MKKTVFKTFRAAFLLLGLFLLYGVVKKIGWTAIEAQVTALSWHFIPILSMGFFWYLCYALAWQDILKQQENKIPFWSLFQSKIAGDSANAMTPIHFLGGDTLRIWLLRRNTTNVTRLAASVVVDRTINSIAIVLVIFTGVVAGFLTIPGLPKQVSIGAPIFLLFTSGLIVFFLMRQHKGLFGGILRLAKKLHIAPHTVTKYEGKAKELDREVLGLYQKSHRAFWVALAYHLLGRLLGIMEVYLIGKAIAPEQFTLLIALLLATLAPIVNMVFTFIPGALGVLEGAYSGALYLLGLNPALGLTIQIIKRMRAGLWMAFGFGIISFRRSHQTSSYNKDPLQRPL
ncbi:MAG: lysylphosphatidylglycerol synthase transmembrane domain-containing protein [Deltaproteobacteria bacterium]|nr:lysylphosphatidylglycerol synthase transmembrane domain-containing protein [Deltaproteobacteria bacterium]